ncbi:neural cell adhesion molecule L1-like isoform X2 [Saccostrea cucullata]|uniref:neural cell adhesion molecule L1-like isoform X2 n=1 Tax=Saccostrea cuccullata TaxID=36930 RepID=UPI002ED3EF3E
MPPKIISTFNNEYYFPMNSKLTDARIECNAKNGNIEYEWKKDGVVVLNSKYVSVDKDTGTLKFNQMQRTDYGTYQCFAKNDFGTSLSPPFEVKMSSMGAFPAKEHEEIQCKEFEHCRIPCRDKPECSPDSECRVEWKIGKGAKTNVELSKRVGVDGNGDLHFIWTKNTDWTGLDYKCGVWQEQLKMLVVGSLTTLRITGARFTPRLDPVLVYKSNGKAQYRGEGVLKCMFSGYPAPEIEWVSPDDEAINNSAKYVISDYNRVLTIKDAMPNDEGHYSCRGKGTHKIDPQRVFLNVTSAPVLNPESEDRQMNDLLVSVGKNATFYCEAVSLPKENAPTPPLWMKNGAVLPTDGNNTGKYILSPDHVMLTVTNVQKGLDCGVFQCMSENSEGVLLKEALLKVIDPITILERPQGNYTIMPGDTLSLGVLATSEPSLSLRFKWTFINLQGEEQVVEDNDIWKISRPTHNNLTIDVSQVSDPSIVLGVSGEYIVDVFHNYDSERIKVTIETETISKIFPVAPLVQKADLSFIIYIAVGVVFLIIVLIVVFCIVRRNRGGVYSVQKKEVAAGHDPEKELLACGFQDLSRTDSV